VQYALVASGRTTALKVQYRKTNNPLYILTARTRAALLQARRSTVEETTDGRKYCFEVPTGFLVFRRNGCVFMSGNTGKTLLTLELLRYWMLRVGNVQKALVLCPTDTAIYGWEQEIERWKIGLPFITLNVSSSKEKWRLLERVSDGIVFATYPGLINMVSDRVQFKKKGKEFIKLVPNEDAVDDFCDGLNALVMDESTKSGSSDRKAGGLRGSLTFRICNRISKRTDVRYALAGRPFGRDPTPLWSQFFLIDRGETLGPTLGLFREALFSKQQSRWNKFDFDYTFKKENEPVLSRLIQHRSIAYSAEECGTLPKIVRIPSYIRLPEEAGAYYKRLVAGIMEARGNYKEMKSVFIRMRQLSSGFLGFKNEETGDRAEVAFEQNPKLERLIDLVEALPADCKAVIFHEFIYSGRVIREALKETGIGFGALWAGMPNAREVQSSFDRSKGMQVLVVPNRLGNYSLNLQVANYELVYESPVSVIDREQMERRVARQGQKKRVFIYDLLVKGTMDERILQFHAEGEELFEALVRNPKAFIQ
jgi:hypothetical protein